MNGTQPLDWGRRASGPYHVFGFNHSLAGDFEIWGTQTETEQDDTNGYYLNDWQVNDGEWEHTFRYEPRAARSTSTPRIREAAGTSCRRGALSESRARTPITTAAASPKAASGRWTARRIYS